MSIENIFEKYLENDELTNYDINFFIKYYEKKLSNNEIETELDSFFSVENISKCNTNFTNDINLFFENNDVCNLDYEIVKNILLFSGYENYIKLYKLNILKKYNIYYNIL